MRHERPSAGETNGTRGRCFEPAEREALMAIARASLPAGKIFPAAGADTVEKVENFLALSGKEVAQGYRAMLKALSASSWLHHRRPIAKLSDEQVLGLLERWRQGDYGGRVILRLLTTPLKVAHFNDARMFEEVGCAWGTLPVAQAEKPRYLRERVTRADQLSVEESIECDVVVIGTGAGGAVAAKELAEKGLAVVMLEEGEYHGRESFTGHAIEMQRKLYRDMGATVSVGNVGIPIPIGRSVGGTTTINSGTCYRAPDRILHKWSHDYGLAELSAERLAPFYERVEGVLEVAPAQAKHLGGVARVIARGCESLGWHHHGPLRRNAPACDGQGICCFGCPTDAKRSTNVSYVPLALKAGAQLFTGLKADRIVYDGDRAVGVIARAGATQLTVRARAVVVACGALLTPLFLEKNGVASRALGRNLSIHPAVAALAHCDELVDGQRAIPQGYTIEQLHDEGLLFEGAFAPLDVGAASFPILGRRLIDLLEDYRRIACFGVMIEDTSRGRVRRGPGGRPFITYWLNDHDVARLKKGVETLARVFFAGGAKRVLPIVHGFDELGPEDLPRLSRAKLRARDFEITAYHPLGTARLGTDARTSVCDADHQVHGRPGLYVTDGSAVPSSPAVNPQLTIMALATRAADKLAAKLS